MQHENNIGGLSTLAPATFKALVMGYSSCSHPSNSCSAAEFDTRATCLAFDPMILSALEH